MSTILKSRLKIDKILLISILLLVLIGIITFLSASLGILSTNQLKFYYLIKSQIIYVFIFGLIALYLGSKIDYKYYKKYSFFIFILSILISLTVFIPGLQFYYNGANRWINLFGLSIQPSEILKFGVVILFSFYCIKYKKYFDNFKFGFLPFIFIMGVVSLLMLLQPDLGTLMIILFSGFMVYFSGGAKWKYIFAIFLLTLLSFFILIQIKPYMKERILTFIEPGRDLLGFSYQLNQSLIAVGSGGELGLGLGQSIQKFNYLPEQISDSIFAVYAEELGFVGSVFLIIIYFFIILRSIYILKKVDDDFGKLLGIGLISIFFIQTFLNLGSTIGLLPLTGVPLPLVSRGGTSLIFLMFELGILLNISKYRAI